MSGCRLSRLADDDLLSIFRYTIETWGEEQLQTYLSILEAGRDRIAQNPLCVGSKAREDLAPGCRIFRAGKHYFVYRIQDDSVQIARILHETMDYDLHVEERAFD